MGIDCTIQRMWNHGDNYPVRLETMLRGMLSQALGHASGPHSSFMPYHIDAITLQTVGDGWHDEMSLGRVVESVFRSVNNLLEHLHQSFFFYLLMNADRFVSIGTYLPSAMLIAVNFTIIAILLWMRSGESTESTPKPGSPNAEKQPAMTLIKEGEFAALVPTKSLEVVERDMFRPVAAVFATHVLGLLPLYIFNQVPEKVNSLSHSATTKLTNATDINKHHSRPTGLSNTHPSNPRRNPLPPHPPNPPKHDANPLFLTPLPRRRPLNPRHTKLLPSPLHRTASLAFIFCPSLLATKKHICRAENRVGGCGCGGHGCGFAACGIVDFEPGCGG